MAENLPEMRDFLDLDKTRDLIFGNVKQAATSRYPMSNDFYSLHLADVNYDHPKQYSLAEQKQALLDRRTLDVPLHGTWRLQDNKSGSVVGESRKVVARVPYLTPRGTFIFRGNEYVLSHQQRLRPGVYAREKENGELESHVNLIPGTGRSFRLFMEPSTGVFKIHIGQADIPAVSILKALGAQDEDMVKAWGAKITHTNLEKDRDFDIAKAYSRLADPSVIKKHVDPHAGIRATFNKMELDPDVSERNLGKPYNKVNAEVLIRSLQKLLNISRRTEEVDDRDSQANQFIYGPEDLFAERIKKDAGNLGRTLLWKATHKKNVDFIPSSALSRQVYSALLSSGLGAPIAEVSPVEIMDQLLRVSRMGDGGIPSTTAIPQEARNVSPSQLGFIDPIRAPESTKIGVDSRVALGVMKGADNQLYRHMIDAKTGKLVIKNARDVTSSVVAFPGEMDDPDKKWVRVIHDGKIRYRPRGVVDLALPHANHMFGIASNLVPGISGIKGGRLLMGGKMSTQALPLEHPESPLVQSLSDSGPESYEQLVGKHMGAIHAKQPGTVTGIKDNHIHVKYADGSKDAIELYDNFPMNQKTTMHNTAVVKPGDKFNAGQLLAKSNFTNDQGHLAIGSNFRVAFMPFKGNYEDAIVISDSAAKKLSSEHLYQTKLDLDDSTEVDKNKYYSLFPGKFNKKQLESIGDDGVVKPGTILNQGDPIVLATNKKEAPKGFAVLKRSREWTQDGSMIWDHPYPGTVTDASNYRNSVKVAVKSYQPAKVGDKLCYSADTQVMTKEGWKPITKIGFDDDILSLADDRSVEYLKPAALNTYHYSGEMYRVTTIGGADLLVTPNHNLYARVGTDDYKLLGAESLYGTQYYLLTGIERMMHVEVDGQDFWEQYSGHVYCVALPRNHVLYVKRPGGTGVWCGNSGRYGNKGVIGCYDDKTEILTDTGWKLFSKLDVTDKVATLDGNDASFVIPEKIVAAPYCGPMYGCKTNRLNYLVTPNHRMYYHSDHIKEYRIADAESLHGRGLWHKVSANYELIDEIGNTVTLPCAAKQGKQAKLNFDKLAFFEFMGWWLAEGNLSYYESDTVGATQVKVRTYKIQISQSKLVNPSKCAKIEDVLNRLGVKWWYCKSTQYTFSHKPLYRYLEQFGLAHQKFIPRGFLKGGREALWRLIDAMHLGAGTKDNGNFRAYKSTSLQLVNDVAEIITLLGGYARVKKVREPVNAQRTQWETWSHRDKKEVTTSVAADSYYIQPYDGMVYCVQVPTGLIYVRRGGKPLWCGNSINADDQMPKDKDGVPFEVTMNPLGIISRTNPSQMVETALAKIARKTGVPYLMPAFSKDSNLQFALDELAKHGMSDTDEVFDPATNKKLKDIFTGEQFLMKLAHTSESKASGRDVGSYSMDMSPARGAGEGGGAKRLGGLELSALVAHGATHVIQDAKMIRGQKNDDYWMNFRTGKPARMPSGVFMYQKFLNMLQAAGVNVDRKGDQLHIMAMTDKDVDKMAGDRELESGDAIELKDQSPIKGGLFDLGLTGGKAGNKWSKITLSEPVPNPLMEEPIIRLLGLTQPAFEKKLREPDGSKQLMHDLKSLDLDREIEKQYDTIKGDKKSKRDAAVKKLRYLTMLKKTGLSPEDMFITKVPVLPPMFRPVTMMKGVELTSDANLLYKDLFEANKSLKDLKGETSDTSDERMTLYNAVKAVQGLGEPVNIKNEEKSVGGMLSHVFGRGSSKWGSVQRKLLSTNVDMVGRAVITPDPKLDMDQTGIPEDTAWTVYRPHIMRRLSRQYNVGDHKVPMVELAKWIQDRDPRARQAMLDEMKARPVIISRAPVWHKFGVLGSWPQLTSDNTMHISPLNYAGLGGDNDGDTMNFHVPASDDAVKEVIAKMMPSKNLYSPATMDVHMTPTQEYLLGLYMASRQPDSKKQPREFATKQDVTRAYQRGEIDINTPVKVLSK